MRQPVFFVKSSENVPRCPCYGGQLIYRDSRLRIRKHEGGDRDYLCSLVATPIFLFIMAYYDGGDPMLFKDYIDSMVNLSKGIDDGKY